MTLNKMREELFVLEGVALNLLLASKIVPLAVVSDIVERLEAVQDSADFWSHFIAEAL